MIAVLPLPRRESPTGLDQHGLGSPTGFVRWWAKTSPSRFAAWPLATSEHRPNRTLPLQDDHVAPRHGTAASVSRPVSSLIGNRHRKFRLLKVHKEERRCGD